MFHYIVFQELRPALRLRFQQEYGSNTALTSLWDRLQAEDQCCGVTGPDEFDNTTGSVRWEMPPSCCLEPTGTSNATRCTKVSDVMYTKIRMFSQGNNLYKCLFIDRK